MDFEKYKVQLILIAKRRVLLAVLGFFVWVVLIDSDNLIDRIDAVNHLNELKNEREYYREIIYKDSVQLHNLQTDKEKFEKFAREQFFMRKPNEDVFVIVEN